MPKLTVGLSTTFTLATSCVRRPNAGLGNGDDCMDQIGATFPASSRWSSTVDPPPPCLHPFHPVHRRLLQQRGDVSRCATPEPYLLRCCSMFAGEIWLLKKAFRFIYAMSFTALLDLLPWFFVGRPPYSLPSALAIPMSNLNVVASLRLSAPISRRLSATTACEARMYFHISPRSTPP
ncbi:hypothetical protein C8R45DRAFT_1213542 [Mycena sanguinolenta]|nr:hypothetical protein C8R45DRAFT_1213542 [Mycena sanguinolenta]